MRRWLRRLFLPVVVAGGLVLASCATPVPSEPQRTYLTSMNDVRSFLRIPFVWYDYDLQRLAQDGAELQCTDESTRAGHRALGLDYHDTRYTADEPNGWLSLGEAIASGRFPNGLPWPVAWDALMHSPAHTQALLTWWITRMGVGHARCADGWDVWVIDIGKPA